MACDGPSQERSGEAEKVAATRQLIDLEIDWPCSIERLYSETNLGCSVGPVCAINWFFSRVDEGIILEDDCVPHPDFFSFTALLLDHYRQDRRIWCIGGSNFQGGVRRGSASYYFSRYASCWGWATWRNRWESFDASLNTWPQLRDSPLLFSLIPNPLERRFWRLIWERTYQYPDTVTWWDYQWHYSLVTNHALSLIPNSNLISNIGFGLDASHTVSSKHLNHIQDLDKSVEMIHPDIMVCDIPADRYLFQHNYLSASMPRRVLMTLKAFLAERARLYSPKTF